MKLTDVKSAVNVAQASAVEQSAGVSALTVTVPFATLSNNALYSSNVQFLNLQEPSAVGKPA